MTTAACWPCCITWGGNRSLKTGGSRVTQGAGAQLPNVRCPALVIMGTLDPDFADPKADLA